MCLLGELLISVRNGRKVKVVQSCPTLCDPVDYIVHGILQARILEWVAFPFSRGSSQPRGRTQVARIVDGFFTSWATRDAEEYWSVWPVPSPVDLPEPGIEPEFLALQTDCLPTELSGKPDHQRRFAQSWGVFQDMALRVSWEARFSVLKPGQSQINQGKVVAIVVRDIRILSWNTNWVINCEMFHSLREHFTKALICNFPS